MKKTAAPGVDGLTWKTYESDLERRLEDLHARVHRGAYRATPSRRVYIPKPDGRQRPLAVAALEDKIVQRATTKALNAIYEEDFLGFSYGFRPGRGAHDAMDALVVGITARKVNWILDADIEKFFDSVSQEWLVRFVEHRIGDKRIIRLIQKWLKAGVLEDGVVTTSDRGTGQGSVISPLLANVYLHYVFDRWAERWRRREATGDMIIVRLSRRHHRRLSARERRPSLLGRDARKARGVCTVAASGQDPPDRIRPLCCDRSRTAGPGQTGDLRLPWLHLHLRQSAQRRLPDQTEDPSRPHAGEAQAGQRGIATTHAPDHRRARPMAGAGGRGVLQLLRRADQTARPALSVTISSIFGGARFERRSQQDRKKWDRMDGLAREFLPMPRVPSPLGPFRRLSTGYRERACPEPWCDAGRAFTQPLPPFARCGIRQSRGARSRQPASPMWKARERPGRRWAQRRLWPRSA